MRTGQPARRPPRSPPAPVAAISLAGAILALVLGPTIQRYLTGDP
jgi:hypothetical protein